MYGGQYLHEDLPTMATAYLFHLTMNRPFVDGNKRIGAIAAFVFLDMNGAQFMAPEMEYRDMVLNLAAGKLDKADAIAFFKRHVQS
jgi:death on curing protein